MRTSASASAVADMLEAATRAFFKADVNEDRCLNFTEFKSIMPASISREANEETLRAAFEMADHDGDGSVSKEEYFWWVLQWTSENAGTSSGVTEALRASDSTGDGELNLREFRSLVERFGFGDLGSLLFEELDKDRTGTISCNELAQALKARRGRYTQDCKRLLTTLSFDLLKQHCPSKEVLDVKFDDKPWTAEDPVGIRAILVERMHKVHERPFTLWSALLNTGATNKLARRLTRKQYDRALRMLLGYKGSTEMANASFEIMDDDESGEVNYDEFMHYINGRPQRTKMARELKMAHHRPADAQPLENLVFTEHLLHGEVKRMLVNAQLSALDLISSFDRSDDGKLSKREFLATMKSIVGQPDVWLNTNVKEVCVQIFDRLAGDDKELDLEELHSWLLLDSPIAKKSPMNQERSRSSKIDVGVEESPPLLQPNRLAPLGKLPKPDAPAALPGVQPSPDPVNGFMSQHFLQRSMSLPEVKTRKVQPDLSLRLAASRASLAARYASEALKKADEASRRRMAAADYAARAAVAAEEERVKLAAAQFESRRTQAHRRRLMLERERFSMH